MTELQISRGNARGLRGEEAAAVNRQIKALAEFLGQAESIMDRFSKSEQNAIVPLAVTMFAKTPK